MDDSPELNLDPPEPRQWLPCHAHIDEEVPDNSSGSGLTSNPARTTHERRHRRPDMNVATDAMESRRLTVGRRGVASAGLAVGDKNRHRQHSGLNSVVNHTQCGG